MQAHEAPGGRHRARHGGRQVAHSQGGRAHAARRRDGDDRAGSLTYLSLSELERDGTCDLVAVTVGRDRYGQAVPREERTTVTVRRARTGERDGSAVLTLTMRAVDYAGERAVERGGRRLAVTKVSGAGAWVEIECAEGAVDRA